MFIWVYRVNEYTRAISLPVWNMQDNSEMKWTGWNDLQRIDFFSPLHSFALLQMNALQSTGCSLIDWDILGNESRHIPSPPCAASYTLWAILPYTPGELTSKAPRWGDLLWTIKKLSAHKGTSADLKLKTLHMQGWFNQELDFKKVIWLYWGTTDGFQSTWCSFRRYTVQNIPTLFCKTTSTMHSCIYIGFSTKRDTFK